MKSAKKSEHLKLRKVVAQRVRELMGARKPFTQELRDVVQNCGYTYRLAREIANPNRKQAITTLAEIYQLGYKKVEGIILKAAELKLDSRRENPSDTIRP